MINQLPPKFYSGTSGLVLKIPKRLFPPEFHDMSRLQYYASLYNSIEINSTFYKVPMAATVGKWSESVPGNFKFTYKLWKGITHNKKLEFNSDDVKHFMKTIDNVGEKKGCLLIQFPPSLSIDHIGQLKKLLKCIRKEDVYRQWLTAVEFRNTSWYQQELYDLLHKNNISLVIHDHPSSITPMIDITTELVYVRFHGIKGDYRGTYSDDSLHANALQMHNWLKAGKTVYAYFNNTIGEAVANLEMLNECVGE